MPKVYVKLTEAILTWAMRKAAKLETENAVYELLNQWRMGKKKPTFHQVEEVSRRLQIPLGYFFLQKPPIEHFPLAEFRTIQSSDHHYEPSANLLDTVDDMLDIQDWMREYVKEEGREKLPFVSSCKKMHDYRNIAQTMRRDLHLPEDWMLERKQAQESFSFLRHKCQDAGILVMMNGIVGNNTHRKLDVREFRAFTLVDEYAPLVFINACDSWNGRVFSLLHEAAHIWLGVNSIYNEMPDNQHHFVSQVEQICNAVAAELLTPKKIFLQKWKDNKEELQEEIKSLANDFSCSEVVIARKALDFGFISKEEYHRVVALAIKLYKRNQDKEDKASGGNFYNTMATRLDNHFVQAVATSAESGRTQYTDAYRLTNTNRDTFDKLYQKIKSKGRVVGYV